MAQPLVLTFRDREYSLRVEADGRVHVGERTLTARRVAGGVVRIDGTPGRVAWIVAQGDTRWVFLDGRVYELVVQRRGPRGRRASTHHGSLTAPMPATVRHVRVRVGDVVKRGDTLIVLEAMKMELPIRASADATVTAISCREGELVQPGTALVEVEEVLNGV